MRFTHGTRAYGSEVAAFAATLERAKPKGLAYLDAVRAFRNDLEFCLTAVSLFARMIPRLRVKTYSTSLRAC